MKREQINVAVKTFCEKFREHPYLHRCEHSLHVALYNELSKLYPEGFSFNNDKTLQTNYVHKEFPGRKKGHASQSNKKLVDRTQIDIAILAKDQQCVLINDFLDGNLDIDYAFELALNYGIEHLCWDIFKFITGSNTSLNHKNYIIHFYNRERNRKYFDKHKIGLLLNDNKMELELNEKVEWCYYLIELCIKYATNKDQKDYDEIVKIVMKFVIKKNIKYDNRYLLDEKEVQKILQEMKFVFIDVNSQTITSSSSINI